MDVYGWYNGSLANSGEKLALENAEGLEVLKFKYNNQAPWPMIDDLQGHSLQIIKPSVNANNPTNWKPSSEVGGSPGK